MAHLPLSKTGELGVGLLLTVERGPAPRAVVRPQSERAAVADQKRKPDNLHQNPPERDAGHQHPQPGNRKRTRHATKVLDKCMLRVNLIEVYSY